MYACNIDTNSGNFCFVPSHFGDTYDHHIMYQTLQAMFLNLLFKSVKSDPEVNRVKAFLKRIIQVCSAHAPSFICGCLFLISEVSIHLLTLFVIFLKLCFSKSIPKIRY